MEHDESTPTRNVLQIDKCKLSEICYNFWLSHIMITKMLRITILEDEGYKIQVSFVIELHVLRLRKLISGMKQLYRRGVWKVWPHEGNLRSSDGTGVPRYE